MIKGKASYPFETLALVVVFTSRLEALIAETKRFAGLFSAKVVFIHVGKRTSYKEKQLSRQLLAYGFNDSNCAVHWQDGSPVDIILTVCKQHVVDLLIMDPHEQESTLKLGTGSNAREITRKAKCSVMMMVDPQTHPVPFRKFVVNGYDHDKTIHTINTTIYFAECEGARDILVVDEMELPAVSLSPMEEMNDRDTMLVKSTFVRDENSKISSLLMLLDKKNMDIKMKTVSGRSGYTIAQFARHAKADLLVVNSPDHHLNIFDRIFSHDLEYVLVDLPCNILLVHSRVF